MVMHMLYCFFVTFSLTYKSVCGGLEMLGLKVWVEYESILISQLLYLKYLQLDKEFSELMWNVIDVLVVRNKCRLQVFLLWC